MTRNPDSSQNEATVLPSEDVGRTRTYFSLTGSELVRLVLAGILLPCLVVTLAWIVASTWSDLPSKYPAHWGEGGVDRFDSPQTYINNQMTVASVAAGISVAIVIIGLLRAAWSPLNKGFSSVAIGVTGAIAMGFFVQLARSRGLTTAEVIELGGGAGILGVVGGFLVPFLIALLVLPKGEYR
ncbi:hypothetical protein U746_2796 [Mycolicibacterium mucogenicum 261Sha1.1M5]|nr:hypothetical protein U746_2796 [Mycolicibacterium mucogenicum 261Sha1.1M5]